jgi:hypothetical protein
MTRRFMYYEHDHIRMCIFKLNFAVLFLKINRGGLAFIFSYLIIREIVFLLRHILLLCHLVPLNKACMCVLLFNTKSKIPVVSKF